MTITLADYQRAESDFLEHLHRMEEEVVSVLLFGSMARDEVNPGRSDIMDAFVFLRREVFEEREAYLNALEIMTQCCERLGQSGIPFHPFFYWDDYTSMSAMFLPPFRSERFSRVIMGSDIRPHIESSMASHAFAGKAFFAARRRGHALAAYLRKPELTPEERKRIAGALLAGRKYFPMLACLALDVRVGESEMVRELEKTFPDMDTAILTRSKILQTHADILNDDEALRGMLREMLEFVERLHELVILKLNETGKLPGS